MIKNKPRISVIMPNLNYRHYLDERIQSVLNQTLTDFEYIIIDSYSDDGAWELIQKYAEKDSRMRISQAPRGIYWTCWNICIQQAKGDYIYIATSDDTMMSDCLEKMVSALDAHPECGICHCCLKVIDEKGKEIPNWWRKNIPAAQFYGELIDKSHIRLAPYDGILHCAIGTVYTSVTQLLIRRSVFDEAGLFRIDWGPEGDYEWGMRASLLFNTLHIAETLATWRIHPNQQTKDCWYPSSAQAKYCKMTKEAFNTMIPKIIIHHPELLKKVSIKRLLFPHTRRYLTFGLRERSNLPEKILFFIRFVISKPLFLAEFIYCYFIKMQGKFNDFIYISEELKRLGLEKCVKIL